MFAFPLFIDLSDKKCVIVGGGKVAERKTETLLLFHAQITVLSPKLTDRLQELEKENRITVVDKEFSEKHLEDAFLVIAATSERLVNNRVYDYSVKNNIFVNVADCPEQCTFIFPSIVQRDSLVVGISTSGSYPALSKKVRQKIEGLLPQTYSEALPILKDIRRKSGEEIPDPKERKEVLKTVISRFDTLADTAGQEDLKNRIYNIYEELKHEKKD